MNDTMSDDKAKILERIRKLLRMTTDNGATAAEMESAIALAHRLMLKYAIAPGEVEENGASSREAMLKSGKRLACHDVYVFTILQTFFAVKIVTKGWRGRQGVQIVAFGRPCDLEIARGVYVFLARQYQSLWRVAVEQSRIDTLFGKRKVVDLGAGAQRSYYAGLTEGICRKLAAQQHEAIQEEPEISRALVRTKSAIDRDLKAAYPQLEMSAPPRDYPKHPGAMMRGLCDAEKVSIRKAIA